MLEKLYVLMFKDGTFFKAGHYLGVEIHKSTIEKDEEYFKDVKKTFSHHEKFRDSEIWPICIGFIAANN